EHPLRVVGVDVTYAEYLGSAALPDHGDDLVTPEELPIGGPAAAAPGPGPFGRQPVEGRLDVGLGESAPAGESHRTTHVRQIPRGNTSARGGHPARRSPPPVSGSLQLLAASRG